MHAGVIFDMDGVLVDSWEPHYKTWEVTMQRRGYSLTREAFSKVFGKTFAGCALQLVGRELPASELEQWHEEKEGLYQEIIERDFPAMPGAASLVSRLHDAGLSLAVGSSGPRGNVAIVARRLPGGQHFRALVCGQDVEHGKPAPDIFLLAAKNAGIDPKKAVVVEDSLPGLTAARAAGMKSIALVGTCTAEALAPHASLVVEHLDQITPEVIAKLLG